MTQPLARNISRPLGANVMSKAGSSVISRGKGQQFEYAFDDTFPVRDQSQANARPHEISFVDNGQRPRLPRVPPRERSPVPDYYYKADGWVVRSRKTPLQIVDTPIRNRNERDDYQWEFEDCAVCRTKSKDGSVVDRVLGCVTFRFSRHLDGSAQITPGPTIRAASKPPGTLWHDALKNWRNWTDK